MTRIFSVAMIVVLLAGATADAQEPVPTVTLREASQVVLPGRTPSDARPMRDFDRMAPLARRGPATSQRTPSQHGLMGTGRGARAARITLAAAAGAAAGFLAGGYIGAKIDGECGCDDPGLKGFLIGAPIGALVGGIFGGVAAR